MFHFSRSIALDTRCALRDNTAMEQTPGPSGNPQFRGNIPSYAAPDRAAWAREHLQPYELHDVPLKFLTRARAAVGRDESTLSFAPAVDAHVRLDEINEAVAYEHGADLNNEQIFYDPQTDSFWAYPERS